MYTTFGTSKDLNTFVWDCIDMHETAIRLSNQLCELKEKHPNEAPYKVDNLAVLSSKKEYVEALQAFADQFNPEGTFSVKVYISEGLRVMCNMAITSDN